MAATTPSETAAEYVSRHSAEWEPAIAEALSTTLRARSSYPLQSIVQSPVAELDELHEKVVAEEGSTMLAAGEEVHISDANATDAVITFKLPSKSAVFGFATQGIVSADGANRSVLSDGFIISINCAPHL